MQHEIGIHLILVTGKLDFTSEDVGDKGCLRLAQDAGGAVKR